MLECFFCYYWFCFAWKLLIVDPDEKTQEAGVNSKQSFMLISKKIPQHGEISKDPPVKKCIIIIKNYINT